MSVETDVASLRSLIGRLTWNPRSRRAQPQGAGRSDPRAGRRTGGSGALPGHCGATRAET